MIKRTPPLTADEFAERLNSSPETIASAKERFERIQQDAAEYRREAEPVVSALRDAGINTSSIRGASKDKKSIPVLLEHLQKSYPRRVLWSIAVALATPAASYAWPILVAEYKKSSNIPGESMGPKDGLANALVATVTKDTIDDLIALVKDPLQGSSRVILLKAIQRSRTPQAKRVIEELGSDPQLAKEIASWRRRKPQAN